MLRAKQPCRQLNSSAIKGNALCFMGPVVSGKCSVISAKCVCDVKERNLKKSWEKICATRDACDTAISEIADVAFFFSAISTQEKSKAKVNDEQEEESDESDELSSQIPTSTFQQWIDGSPTVVNKSLYPAISYWLALTTPNGAPANPITVHRKLLKHMNGVSVPAKQATFAEGKECEAMRELYKVLKDHKNPFMEDLVQSSYRHTFAMEHRNVVGAGNLSLQELDNCGTENVVRVTLVSSRFHSVLATAIDKLLGAGLRIDKFRFDAVDTGGENSSPLEKATGDKMLSDKLTVLINDISIAMKQLGYASYRGTIYKKDSRSKFTYAYKCDAAAFINTLATNEFFKARLVREMKNVIGLLSDPYCELFSPLIINHDLIEVSDGWCWSVKRHSFVQDAIQDHQIGKVSPRAFCVYDPAEEPKPKYFKGVLENSLGEQDLRNFCHDFLKLLSYNQKRHKDKVPCLVGDANSGKTSLFFPILGLIHHGNVATVTKQRAFNKSMITPYTEVIFIDEATEKTLDMDDWKILTQGGYAAHDVKYRNA
ncbi:hypothetical protein ACROYT_G027241 [Oculina patagonica]